MELYFNELSIEGKESLEYNDIKVLSGIYKRMVSHDVTSCRIDDSSYAKIYTLINQMKNSGNAKNFFFSFFHRPFENFGVLQHEDEYYLHKWCYDNRNCIGLALSYMMEAISLSLNDKDWDKSHIDIMKDDEPLEVRNISREEHIDIHEKWIEDQKEVVLVRRTREATEDDIVLRDDHGKDILFRFCKKIIKNKYVISVVNSLPFNPYERKFIHAVKEDGLIEIVLPWTDEGLGFVVKTTGRRKRETEKIAEILKNEYGHMD